KVSPRSFHSSVKNNRRAISSRPYNNLGGVRFQARRPARRPYAGRQRFPRNDRGGSGPCRPPLPPPCSFNFRKRLPPGHPLRDGQDTRCRFIIIKRNNEWPPSIKDIGKESPVRAKHRTSP